MVSKLCINQHRSVTSLKKSSQLFLLLHDCNLGCEPLSHSTLSLSAWVTEPESFPINCRTIHKYITYYTENRNILPSMILILLEKTHPKSPKLHIVRRRNQYWLLLNVNYLHSFAYCHCLRAKDIQNHHIAHECDDNIKSVESIDGDGVLHVTVSQMSATAIPLIKSMTYFGLYPVV